MKKMKIIIFYLTLILLFGINHSLYAQSCACGTEGSNLVVDGGFEYTCGARYPFTSDMLQSCTPFSTLIYSNPQGIYYIGKGSQFANWSGTPHTGTSYFVGDGTYGNLPKSNRAWSQTVSVQAGTTYQFSMFYMFESGVVPQLDLTIIDATTHVLANSTYSSSLTWTRLCGLYTATTTGTVTLNVIENAVSTGWMGSDFGLDDITFNSIVPTTVTIPSSTICKGITKTLTPTITNGSGNYSYLWSTGEKTQSISVTPSSTSKYTVTVKDINSGCVVSNTATITVTDLHVFVGDDFGMCPTNPNALITSNVSGGSGSYSYLWNTGATTPNITVNYANPGTYTLTVRENTTSCTAADQINIYQASCSGIQYFQNTSSLPSLTQYNNITAGNHVDGSKSTGDVNVLNGQNVTFEGGNQVSLEDGFHAFPGSQFFAYIIPGCIFTNLAINQTKLDYCTFRLAVNSTGSGSYSYLWSNGSTSPYIDVSPTSATTYSLSVTDNCLGNSITVQSQVTPNYRGGISAAYNNLVTPNGDGYNDMFIVADGGKQQFAFNAYAFTLNVYDRWGGQVWAQSGITPLNGTGFKQGDIYWNPNSPSVSDGVYYMNFTLANCDNTYSQKSWVQVIRSLNRVTSNTDDTNLRDTLLTATPIVENISVFPNPASDKLQFTTSGYLNTYDAVTINVFDSFGAIKLSLKEIATTEPNNTIPISSLKDGMYIIEFIYPGNQKYRTKFTKITQ
jgi:hypothetical protein